MPTIYIAGVSSGSGTTAVAAGIATLLERKGSDVTLAKALRVGLSDPPDSDEVFHQSLFPKNAAPSGWPNSVGSVHDTSELDGVIAKLKGTNLPQGLTIVDGVSGDISDTERVRIDGVLAQVLDATVILVSNGTSAPPAQVAQAFDGRIIGTIINSMPEQAMHHAETTLTALFEQQGIAVLGVIPETRRMLAFTVGEIAKHLGADLINSAALTSPEERMGELVEHFMLGGLFLDRGAYVFGRRENKAVIVRGDRPDLQMAALDTSTACLILTNDKTPVQYIAHHAGLRQTPMLATPAPTLEVMERLHSIGDRGSVNSAHKVQCFAGLLEAHCNLESLTVKAAN